MTRLMSVAYTEDAVRQRTKTVTRRAGWWHDKNGRRLLVPGDRLTLCRKVMGRKKGEPLVRIVDVEVIDVRRERLDQIDARDVAREGFPGMSPEEFIDRFFVEAQRIAPFHFVTRIEWRYLNGPPVMSITPEELELAVRMRDEATAMGDHRSAADITTWLGEHPVDYEEPPT